MKDAHASDELNQNGLAQADSDLSVLSHPIQLLLKTQTIQVLASLC
jgi:hypothetical protein